MHNPFHELKTWPFYFGAIWAGTKAFEMRYNDRDFQSGDIVWLREWVPADDWHISRHGHYTGRSIKMLVTYVLFEHPAFEEMPEFVPDGWCIMSLREIPGTREL